MRKLLGAWLVAGLSLWLTSLVLGHNMVFDGFWPIVWTAAVVGLMNYILAPILNFLTCPVYLLTLGLSRFLVSGLVLIIARDIVRGFTVRNFWWAVLAAIIVSVLNSVLDGLTGRKGE